MQLVAHPDDAQQGVGLLSAGSVHKFRQIQGKLLHKFVEQLLARPAPFRVCDGQGGIFAFALHYEPVGEGDLQVRRNRGALPLRVGGAVFFPAQRPGDAVQHRGLPLPVPASDDSQAVRRRFQPHRLDPLDVFDFQAADLDLPGIPGHAASLIPALVFGRRAPGCAPGSGLPHWIVPVHLDIPSSFWYDVPVVIFACLVRVPARAGLFFVRRLTAAGNSPRRFCHAPGFGRRKQVAPLGRWLPILRSFALISTQLSAPAPAPSSATPAIAAGSWSVQRSSIPGRMRAAERVSRLVIFMEIILFLSFGNHFGRCTFGSSGPPMR